MLSMQARNKTVCTSPINVTWLERLSEYMVSPAVQEHDGTVEAFYLHIAAYGN